MAIKVYVNSIKAELMCNLSNISKILEDKLKFMFFVFSIYQKPSSNTSKTQFFMFKENV